jgi:hypothetical protein
MPEKYHLISSVTCPWEDQATPYATAKSSMNNPRSHVLRAIMAFLISWGVSSDISL